MAKMYGMNMPFGAMPVEETLVLNGNNNVVKLLLNIKDDQNKKEETSLICNQIYDLATMSHKHLDMNEMTNFIERSNKILEMLMDK